MVMATPAWMDGASLELFTAPQTHEPALTLNSSALLISNRLGSVLSKHHQTPFSGKSLKSLTNPISSTDDDSSCPNLCPSPLHKPQGSKVPEVEPDPHLPPARS